MGRGKGWPTSELWVLCKAWIKVSESPEDYEDEGGFWNGVVSVFHELSDKTRSRTAITKLWAQISREVARFTDVYHIIEKQVENTSEDELIQLSLQAFYDQRKRKFKYIDCWKILANCSVWRGPMHWNKKEIDVSAVSLDEQIEEKRLERLAKRKRKSKSIDEGTVMPSATVDIKKLKNLKGLSGGSSSGGLSSSIATTNLLKKVLDETRRNNALIEESNAIRVFSRPEFPNRELSRKFFERLEDRYLKMLDLGGDIELKDDSSHKKENSVVL